MVAFEPLNPEADIGSQVCEVTPLLTKVQVEYGGGIMNIGKTLSSSTFDQIDPDGLMVRYMGQSVGDQIYAAQASNLVGNPILDSINGFVATQSLASMSQNWSRIFVSSFATSLFAAHVSEIGGLLAWRARRISHSKGNVSMGKAHIDEHDFDRRFVSQPLTCLPTRA